MRQMSTPEVRHRLPEPFAPLLVSPPYSWEWRGERLRWTRRSVTLLATPDSVGNAHIAIGMARIPARQAAPWHRHTGHEEFVFVLEGNGEFCCELVPPQPITSGSLNVIPPDQWHLHRAAQDEDLLFLWGYAPPGIQLTS